MLYNQNLSQFNKTRISTKQKSRTILLFGGISYAVLGIFFLGYLLINSRLPATEVTSYILLSVLSIFSIYVFMSVVFVENYLAVLHFLVLFFLLFVAYYVKFWWIVFSPDSVSKIPVASLAAYSDSTLFATFQLITLGFTCFALTSSALVLILRKSSRIVREGSQEEPLSHLWSTLTKRLFEVLPALSFSILCLLYIFGIGVMGVSANQLPFKLTGIIYYIGTILIPALQLLLIHAARQSRRYKPLGFPLILILLYGLALTILYASRGIFLYTMLSVTLLLLQYPEYRLKALNVILATLFVTSIIYTFVTIYRRSLIDANGIISNSLSSAQNSNLLAQDEFSISNVVTGFQFILFRIVGTDSLLAMLFRYTEPIGINNIISGKVSPTYYFTHQVLRYPVWAVHGSAASLFGWFYLVGGLWGTLVGITLFTLLTGIIWHIFHLFEQRKWVFIPVVRSVFLLRVIILASDGVFENIGELILVMLLTFFLFYLLTRFINNSTLYRGRVASRSRIFQS